MGLFDDELTLPGVSTDILPATDSSILEYGTTDSVTIIGTAFNGPVGEPQRIGSPEMARYIFGESFDTATKREATLVAEIQDAYNKGCRSIQAVRVSGKEMYKDFELAVETNLKLRVSGYFPHNGNKECFMTFSMKQEGNGAFDTEEGVIRIYKPASRTVISEKIAGVVDVASSNLVTEIFLGSEGFERSSRLCDVLDVMNKKKTNNVLKFSLVDENGVQKTNASKEVQAIPVAALFPGIYTVGRDKVAKNVTTQTTIQVKTSVLAGAEDAVVWKLLKVNSDVTKPYPLGAAQINEFGKLIGRSTVNDYKFIEEYRLIDSICIKDKIDYEEVELSGLELYKKLGAGFLRTACLKETAKGGGTKVIAAPDGDPERIAAIEEGIYSKLRMHETDYFVLAAATAETEITGKLPRKKAFKIAIAKDGELKNAGETKIKVAAKIDARDVDAKIVKYDMKIDGELVGLSTDTILASLEDAKNIVRLPGVKNMPQGKQKGLAEGIIAYDLEAKKVIRLQDGKFEVAEDAIEEGTLILIEEDGKLKLIDKAGADAKTQVTKDYFVAMSGSKANVYKKDDLELIMSLKDLAEKKIDEEDYIVVGIEEELPMIDESVNKAKARVHATSMEYDIVAELVDELNDHEELGKVFKFDIATNKENDDCSEFAEDGIKGEFDSREEGTQDDINLHIPYTTTDNFARHLAQHVLYTSLYCHPCHGVIGCDKLNGISLGTVADRVNEVCALNLDMYAKKPNGNYLVDSNNNPWPIGRCVSVVFGQNTVGTGSGYDYVSSGAASYAGMISTLDATTSSTNQKINITTDSLTMNLSSYQLTKLNAAGIVCFRQNGNDVVVVDGITQAPSDSPYRRLSTTKTINTVAKILKDAVQPFIGQQQTLATMNALETAIKSALKNITGVLINEYDFNIETDTESNQLGIVKVNYMIVPAREIKQVRNSISVK